MFDVKCDVLLQVILLNGLITNNLLKLYRCKMKT